MRRAAFAIAIMFLVGCASSGRWQVSERSDGGSILLDTQTGETWIRSTDSSDGGKTYTTYWLKMGRRSTTTMP
jgi:hypothetical protein